MQGLSCGGCDIAVTVRLGMLSRRCKQAKQGTSWEKGALKGELGSGDRPYAAGANVRSRTQKHREEWQHALLVYRAPNERAQ